MLVIGEKPLEGLFYIKIKNLYISGDNVRILACILREFERNPDLTTVAVKNKLGERVIVYLVDLRTKTAEELSFEDYRGKKINYPSIVEIECDNVPETYLKRVGRDKGVIAFVKRNTKKIVFYSALLLGSLGFLYQTLTETPPPPPPKNVAGQVPKPVKKKLEKKAECLTNLPGFVNNFVLGAKVQTDKEGNVFITYQTHSGELIKAKLPLQTWNKPFPKSITLATGMRVKKTELGYEFVGKDYDICLAFIQDNTDKPLYIISLDEKGCTIVLPNNCLNLFAKSSASEK